MQTKRRKQTKRVRREGWGPAILVDFPSEADQKLEATRKALGLDRTTFVRTVVMQRLLSEVAA